ncbi:MAG: hypothetical protein HFJ45_09420 [Clostridia bacterium]|nr:hypothetical protein [Clostridia bacterium]
MFNEKKYLKCIKNLIGIKASIVIVYIVIFAIIGALIGIPIMNEFTYEETTIIISAVIGGCFGLIIGLSSTWHIEMKIQESYWRIDVINELKKQNLVKSTPVAKTVVAIENKQAPKVEESKTEIKEVTSANNE